MQNAIAYSILSAALLAAPLAAGKASSIAHEPDRIDVIAHVPLSGNPVVQLTSGVHWQRDFLYLDRGSTSPVTILDVTDPTAPKAAGTIDLPKQEANGNVAAVVGTAVLVGSSAPASRPQTVTILNFADPERPKVAQRFSGVTSMLKDTSRGLVYLTNPEGLWVLRLDAATDVKLQKDYQNYVLYYH